MPTDINDAINRLLTVKDNQGAEIARYAYDALNRRVLKEASGQTTAFFYDRNQVIEERINDTVERQYVYGRGIDEVLQLRTGGQDVYYHDNSIGSIVALTDAAGAAG